MLLAQSLRSLLALGSLTTAVAGAYVALRARRAMTTVRRPPTVTASSMWLGTGMGAGTGTCSIKIPVRYMQDASRRTAVEELLRRGKQFLETSQDDSCDQHAKVTAWLAEAEACAIATNPARGSASQQKARATRRENSRGKSRRPV